MIGCDTIRGGSAIAFAELGSYGTTVLTIILLAALTVGTARLVEKNGL